MRRTTQRRISGMWLLPMILLFGGVQRAFAQDAAPPPAPAASPAAPAHAQQTREAVIQEITIRGTVEAVDHTARTVRIRGDQGNIVTLDIPATVTRFDQVKPGDILTIAYYDRVNIRLKPAGEAAVDRVVAPTTTITPGLLPGGARSTQRVTTVTIDAWDPATRMVTFTTPGGQKYTRRVNETLGAGLLSGLKVGDRVDVTRTEATRLSVERSMPSFEVYGFAMLDIGHNFTQINPNWFDTLRVTRLPSFEDEFCCDNSTFSGVRQSRLGVRSTTPTDLGELKTTFEFELFGTGVDEGQTTFRLRHAYGELGHFGAGQYWSPFTDVDAFPNSLEYWGPTGLAWYRNVQFRWIALTDDKQSVIVALERPGASGDQGVYADRVELQGIRARFPIPDFSGAYKRNMNWGYVRAAGQLRYIKWDDVLDDAFDLSGSATGWGINLSSNLKVGSADIVRAAFVFGEGIQNAMNDSPIDIGIQNQFQNAVTPITGKAIPLTALSLFVDHTWNSKFSSAVGYSRQDNDNTDGQASNAFKTGQYALGNVLYTPVPNVMAGAEFQWGRRENNSDGFHSDGIKLQFSFKYNFSYKLGG